MPEKFRLAPDRFVFIKPGNPAIFQGLSPDNILQTIKITYPVFGLNCPESHKMRENARNGTAIFRILVLKNQKSTFNFKKYLKYQYVKYMAQQLLNTPYRKAA